MSEAKRPLAVGERVAVYGCLEPRERSGAQFSRGLRGTIDHINDDGDEVTLRLDNIEKRYTVHLKQVRRLVSKPRREWILVKTKGRDGVYRDTARGPFLSEFEEVHVREVRRKKK